EPWYLLARQAKRAVWIDTNRNIDDERDRSTASVTHACPLLGPKGQEYAFGLDFYLFSLCEYLRGVPVSENGMAFIVERERDGQRRLVAHPE
ncbi:hypothetical protein ACO1MN_14585, partial [Staphylococcus aureus]